MLLCIEKSMMISKNGLNQQKRYLTSLKSFLQMILSRCLIISFKLLEKIKQQRLFPNLWE